MVEQGTTLHGQLDGRSVAVQWFHRRWTIHPMGWLRMDQASNPHQLPLIRCGVYVQQER